MAQQITCYLSADGQIHRSQEDAEFSDWSTDTRGDAALFLAQAKREDKDGALARMIADYELWKLGGFAGWKATHCMETPAAAQLPAAPPAAIKVDTPPPAVPAKAASKPEPVKPTVEFRKKVAVVGLHSSHHREFEKEFGEVFKLTLIDAHDPSRTIPKLENLKGHHKVFLLPKFNHFATALRLLRQLGLEPLVVQTSTELKATLEEMFAAS